jgi:hypothetical protein
LPLSLNEGDIGVVGVACGDVTVVCEVSDDLSVDVTVVAVSITGNAVTVVCDGGCSGVSAESLTPEIVFLERSKESESKVWTLYIVQSLDDPESGLSGVWAMGGVSCLGVVCEVSDDLSVDLAVRWDCIACPKLG